MFILMRMMISAVIICLMMILAGCGSNIQEQDSHDNDVGISHLRQLVAIDNKTARSIMWKAKAKEKYEVEYRLFGNRESQIIKAEDSSFEDAGNTYFQYTARLKGLEPNSSYEYRIRTSKNNGKWHKLQTDGGEAFTALIFPDSQSADYAVWSELARGAYHRHPESSFYVNMGDLVDNGQDSNQWNKWFDSVSIFSDGIPLAPLLGNHEAYSLEWKECMPVAYVHLFDVPQNGSVNYKNQFYSYDYGSVHFTVLDTNFSEMENFQPQLLADELKWLEKDLSESSAKWKVIFMHRDIFLYGFNPKSGRQHTETHFLDFSYSLMPLFEKYNVDVVLTAHLHTYRRRLPLRNFAPAVDGRGITYILTGVAGDVRYPNLWDDFTWDVGRAPQPETNNYMTMRADSNSLEFKAYLADGKEFDCVRLEK